MPTFSLFLISEDYSHFLIGSDFFLKKKDVCLGCVYVRLIYFQSASSSHYQKGKWWFKNILWEALAQCLYQTKDLLVFVFIITSLRLLCCSFASRLVGKCIPEAGQVSVRRSTPGDLTNELLRWLWSPLSTCILQQCVHSRQNECLNPCWNPNPQYDGIWIHYMKPWKVIRV